MARDITLISPAEVPWCKNHDDLGGENNGKPYKTTMISGSHYFRKHPFKFENWFDLSNFMTSHLKYKEIYTLVTCKNPLSCLR